MMRPAISIICPIYNMQASLHKCIDSLLSQSFSDFEILLIDDGSTDRSELYVMNMRQRIFVFGSFIRRTGVFPRLVSAVLTMHAVNIRSMPIRTIGLIRQ